MPLRLDLAYALLSGRAETSSGDLELRDPRDGRVAAEVELLSRALGLKPTCVISYIRKAFVGGPYEPGLRVTFDEALTSASPREGLALGGARHFFLPPDLLILEVKANEAIPLWVSGLLARHGCALRRFSKYCSGLARLLAAGESANSLQGELDG
jgi:hypothetical protein